MERRFIRSGIPGLDEVLGGGFLEGSIVAVSGPTGSGKSTFASQFLYNGASQYDEPGLYIAIEESRADFFFHMGGFDWDFAGLEREKRFILLDYPIHEVDQILNQYGAVQEIINSTGVRRVVIDSIMPIALFFQTEDERKKGLLRLIDNIRKWKVTTMLVSEDLKATEPGQIPNTAYGIESYSDGWVNLSYKYDEKAMERTRYIDILKMKGAAHSSKSYRLKVTGKGLEVLDGDAESAPQVQEKPAAKQKPEVNAAPEGKPAMRRLSFKMEKPKIVRKPK